MKAFARKRLLSLKYWDKIVYERDHVSTEDKRREKYHNLGYKFLEENFIKLPPWYYKGVKEEKKNCGAFIIALEKFREFDMEDNVTHGTSKTIDLVDGRRQSSWKKNEDLGLRLSKFVNLRVHMNIGSNEESEPQTY